MRLKQERIDRGYYRSNYKTLKSWPVLLWSFQVLQQLKKGYTSLMTNF
jgi:hypothetical protein